MTVQVQPAEYYRLLGYPRDYVPTGRACELIELTREWYARHGRPWAHAGQAENIALSESTARIGGKEFTSTRLVKTLREADAHAAIVVAVSAGPEAEEEAQRLWHDEKPDEYFFLEMFASAVVEQLVTDTGAGLCAQAEQHGMAVLPHYSPGYAGWDVAEQPQLRALLGELPGPLEVLDSGALRPKKSQLAVFGLTRKPASLGRLTDRLPCENCSFGPCQYRRAPYRRDRPGSPELPVSGDRSYATNRKALKRWAAERLKMSRTSEGVCARFRYDGTTCTNSGRPLAFDYDVKLGPRDQGYPILEQRCAPAPGDTGHTFMCQYSAPLMHAVTNEAPLLGQPLGDVLSWRRPIAAAGCYCEAATRDHKWGLVLETIHYALHEDSTGSH